MRISVVGNSGSGKSTAARKLEQRLGVTRLELDSVRHQPGWVELDDAEFRHRVTAFMDEHESWVIDGNYSLVQPDVWRRAELVVWLDLPKSENMRNIVWRTTRRVLLRKELWNGNRERWTNLLSVDPHKSVIAWAWSRHALVRERYNHARTAAEWSHLRFVPLQSRADLETWLSSLGGA
jgi:adenylate kinase family enzyme